MFNETISAQITAVKRNGIVAKYVCYTYTELCGGRVVCCSFSPRGINAIYQQNYRPKCEIYLALKCGVIVVSCGKNFCFTIRVCIYSRYTCDSPRIAFSVD